MLCSFSPLFQKHNNNKKKLYNNMIWFYFSWTTGRCSTCLILYKKSDQRDWVNFVVVVCNRDALSRGYKVTKSCELLASELTDYKNLITQLLQFFFFVSANRICFDFVAGRSCWRISFCYSYMTRLLHFCLKTDFQFHV